MSTARHASHADKAGSQPSVTTLMTPRSLTRRWRSFARRVQYHRGSFLEEWGVLRTAVLALILLVTILVLGLVDASPVVIVTTTSVIAVVTLVLLAPVEKQ